MTRHRARPSFTVEIKRNRSTPLTPLADSEDPSREPPRRPAARGLWEGTGLFEEAAAATQSGRFDPPAPAAAPEPAPAPRAAAAAAPAKRILPSLIAPPEPPAPEPVEPEPDLRPAPRRRSGAEASERRAARGRPAAARPAFVWPEDWPDEVPVAAPAPATPVAAPASAPPPPPEASDPLEAADARGRPKRRLADADLRVGQRWKRRLPRVCW
ncbi:hypothetical protein OPKNFCMD_1214 [Methylobacterium crusticola]|uniref:DNA-binding protein n=1 Tax=Methylobacterium crusticola TaxID=1697972 RepID=A0ABQ4QT48_9HYPH|nr:hypothetical protein [Methylobacterium crusticola]GJD48493.1 hypothetical protein OPKNFCMD_1214 [Methylobacterium crusticola]